jgi:signal transduction histidine kinase
MILPKIPENEALRQQALDSLTILDTLPEQDFDDITLLASQICNVPIALISLVDKKRQWVKSKVGLAVNETPREHSFCAHAINAPSELMIVEDARLDKRFYDNPLVTGEPNVVFYAGVTLTSPEGYSYGSLCVIDNEPRILTDKQKNALNALGRQVMSQLQTKKRNQELEEIKRELEAKNLELSSFAQTVSHDLKSPVYGISSSCDLLLKDKKFNLNQEAKQAVDVIRTGSNSINKFITDMLQYTKASNFSLVIDKVNVLDLVNETVMLAMPPPDFSVSVTGDAKDYHTDEVALKQILLNLVSNSIKYNDKEQGEININIVDSNKGFIITITDNGMGIPSSNRNKIFSIFQTAHVADRHGNKGTGIGLATVKRLAEKIGATITLDSSYTNGARFKLVVPDCIPKSKSIPSLNKIFE